MCFPVACAQIVQSCVFAVMETFCPKDAEPEDTFEFYVGTMEFELPKVRFSFSTRYAASLTPYPPCPADRSHI